MKITAVLVVDEIEKSLPFWIDRLGFEKVAEVAHGGRLGFILLMREGAELMLQTAASVAQDVPAFAPHGEIVPASLFIEVDDFEDAKKRLAGYPVALQERTTFYGMREIGVFEPGGHIVVVAARTSS